MTFDNLEGIIRIIWTVNLGLQAVTMVVNVKTSYRLIYTGRYISKPLIRRLGYRRTVTLNFGLLLSVVPALFLDGWYSIPSAMAGLVYSIWRVDDAFFGGDDDGKRKYEWARNKLRKLRHVRLRPAQRWAPAPA